MNAQFSMTNLVNTILETDNVSAAAWKKVLVLLQSDSPCFTRDQISRLVESIAQHIKQTHKESIGTIGLVFKEILSLDDSQFGPSDLRILLFLSLKWGENRLVWDDRHPSSWRRWEEETDTDLFLDLINDVQVDSITKIEALDALQRLFDNGTFRCDSMVRSLPTLNAVSCGYVSFLTVFII